MVMDYTAFLLYNIIMTIKIAMLQGTQRKENLLCRILDYLIYLHVHLFSIQTADQLVGLLNDLFGRFDIICKRSGCEKISTLGDCYYSVSGCPEPRPDHAQCCVAMGLAMIDAIQEFDAASNEAVNMRVGIHTGKVNKNFWCTVGR